MNIYSASGPLGNICPNDCGISPAGGPDWLLQLSPIMEVNTAAVIIARAGGALGWRRWRRLRLPRYEATRHNHSCRTLIRPQHQLEDRGGYRYVWGTGTCVFIVNRAVGSEGRWRREVRKTVSTFSYVLLLQTHSLKCTTLLCPFSP